MRMIIELRKNAFDPWVELAGIVNRSQGLSGKAGANAVFVGSMRDFNDGEAVHSLYLEHYPGMTERELEALCREADTDGEALETLVLHRVGEVVPGEAIVLVSVWSAHRAAAFRICRGVMESLKHRAPFWKKETLGDRHRWVETNTPG
jgi:molybdopterin synthase catalytic subunit